MDESISSPRNQQQQQIPTATSSAKATCSRPSLLTALILLILVFLVLYSPRMPFTSGSVTQTTAYSLRRRSDLQNVARALNARTQPQQPRHTSTDKKMLTPSTRGMGMTVPGGTVVTGHLDDESKVLTKKYRCRFTDAWIATRSEPHPMAIFSLLSDSGQHQTENYLRGLEVLGYSLREFAPSPKKVPRYVMVMEGTPCMNMCLRRLHDSGWRVCRAPKLRPPQPSSFSLYRDQFIKLILWNTIQFRRILYMDSDTLAVGSLDRILGTAVTSQQPISATHGMQAGRFVKAFNMGVAVIKTSALEFVRLYNAMAGDSVQYNKVMAEQAFLNAIYSKTVVPMRWEDNANENILRYKPNLWKARRNDTRIIHFTAIKPWAKSSNSVFQPFLDKWKMRRQQVCRSRCTKNNGSGCGMAVAANCQCQEYQGNTCDRTRKRKDQKTQKADD